MMRFNSNFTHLGDICPEWQNIVKNAVFNNLPFETQQHYRQQHQVGKRGEYQRK
jgi:hypothetical protein